MKYKANHASEDLARALCLDKTAEQRIDDAIRKAIDEVRSDGRGTINVDGIIEILTPYIKTPEEAFYAATALFTTIASARGML